MDYRNRVKNIFSYLLSLKKLNRKVIRSVYDYEKFYWEEDFSHISGCTVNKLNINEPWIEVNIKCGKLYEEFFHIYQENEKNEDNFEVVFGHGLLLWKRGNEKILHPVLTTRMKIGFDRGKEVFTLIPSSKTVLETSLFEGFEECNIHDIFALADRINRINIQIYIILLLFL